ncbi:MAG: hypothetical protein L0Y72_06270 [Gemmataceae bacterium]|nr:hypothetical protein [Gemmataceae bacterium]MCI0738632.1 hypothetical protein [Gemmataceae bacterium]
MSRSSEIVIGITTLFGAIVMALLAPHMGDAGLGILRYYGIAALLAVVTLACFFKRGRVITMRITALGVCVAIIFGSVGPIAKGEFSEHSVFFLLIGVGAGVYAVFGGYPQWAPLAHVFRGEPED